MVPEPTTSPQPPLRSFYEHPAPDRTRSGDGRARRQLEMLLDAVGQANRPVRIVDVGCGDGTHTLGAADALRRHALGGHGQAPVSVIGLDWSLPALRQARSLGLPVSRASVEPPGLPLASGTVDVVVMSEFLEHLVDPDAALDEARRVLVPGGHLLVSTPNLAAWFNRFLLLAGVQPVFSEVSLRGIYGRPGKEVVGHLRLFTKRALVQLLAAHGFVGIELAGAPFHGVPRLLAPVDRLMCARPGWSSILLASAATPASPE